MRPTTGNSFVWWHYHEHVLPFPLFSMVSLRFYENEAGGANLWPEPRLVSGMWWYFYTETNTEINESSSDPTAEGIASLVMLHHSPQDASPSSLTQNPSWCGYWDRLAESGIMEELTTPNLFVWLYLWLTSRSVKPFSIKIQGEENIFFFLNKQIKK